MQDIEYRGIVERQGTITLCSAWDGDGLLVSFAADWHMVKNLPVGVMIEVPTYAILSRVPAFEVA
jgi:hypothetical protein